MLHLLARLSAAFLLVCAVAVQAQAVSDPLYVELLPVEAPEDGSLRVAVFNIWELTCEKIEEINDDGQGLHEQLLAAASIVQAVRPHVLIILEVDHDYRGEQPDLIGPTRLFHDAYLARGPRPISYPYDFVAANNTGILSGADLSNDGYTATSADRGSREYGVDAFGYGEYPGQYSMSILSQVPLDSDNARTFQEFLWRDLPDSLIGDDLFDEEAAAVARLSSKSHWDVPVVHNGRPIHLLISHPTPQGFDGEEDRNGRRNTDELRFWRFYIDGEESIYDDAGTRGGLPEGAEFIIAGDLNAEPASGSEYFEKFGMQWLLEHPRVVDPVDYQMANGPLRGRKAGAPDYPERVTITGRSDAPRRIDYALPSNGLDVTGGGIYWPSSEESLAGFALSLVASDHRLIWIDIR